MEGSLELIKKAKKGTIVPVYKKIDNISPYDFFAKLSNNGNNLNSVLFESEDFLICTNNPCLKISGTKNDFEIRALSNLGRDLLTSFKKEFNFCDKVEYKNEFIKGTLAPSTRNVDEFQKPKLKSHIDILRKISSKFKPSSPMPAGLIGYFSYDFHKAEFMENKETLLNVPDYLFYLVDNFFLYDKKESSCFIVSNAILIDDRKELAYKRCLATLDGYEKMIKSKTLKPKKYKSKKWSIEPLIPTKEFESIIKNCHETITRGDVLFLCPMNIYISEYNSDPLPIYTSLNKRNGLFLHSKEGVFISNGNSYLNIRGGEIESMLVRERASENDDPDYDNRLEANMRIDSEDLSKYMMSIDAARNEIAKISKPGTRRLTKPFSIENAGSIKKETTTLNSVIREGYDSLNAYLALTNNFSIAGIPKFEAIKKLRELEKTKRGFFGGNFALISFNGDILSSTVEEGIILCSKKAYLNLFQGVFTENKDYIDETKLKNRIAAIKSSGGMK